MSARWWMAGGGVVVVATLGALLSVRIRKPPPPKSPPIAPIAAPKPPSEVTLIGTIQATKFISVGAPIDGTIEQIIADVGDDVTKSEVLARIRNPKLASDQQEARLEGERARNKVQELEAQMIAARLEVSRAEADASRIQLELGKTEKEFKRQEMMMHEGVTPRLTYEKAQQDYQAAKLQSEQFAEARKLATEHVASLTKELEVARKIAEKSPAQIDGVSTGPAAGEVISPADGIVTAHRGKEGEPIAKKVADFYQLAVDLEKLAVSAPVDAQTAPRIHAGQTATIQIKDFPNTAQGTVREVKNGQVTVDFARPAPGVRPGMTAQAKLKF